MLPNLLRNVFATFTRDPLRRRCRELPRFRPALELLELRMMPTVTADYFASGLYAGTLLLYATSSQSVTAMTVTGSTNNEVTLALTGDTFSLFGDAGQSGLSSSDFVLRQLEEIGLVESRWFRSRVVDFVSSRKTLSTQGRHR